MDFLAMMSIVTTFATFVTAHVALAYGLISRRPLWQTALAFVVFPLAPYFGFVERLRLRSALWCAAAVAYVAAFVATRVLAP